MTKVRVIFVLLSFAAGCCSRPDRGTVYNPSQPPGRYALTTNDPNAQPLAVRDVPPGQFVGIEYEGRRRWALVIDENKQTVWRQELPAPAEDFYWKPVTASVTTKP